MRNEVQGHRGGGLSGGGFGKGETLGRAPYGSGGRGAARVAVVDEATALLGGAGATGAVAPERRGGGGTGTRGERETLFKF